MWNLSIFQLRRSEFGIIWLQIMRILFVEPNIHQPFIHFKCQRRRLCSTSFRHIYSLPSWISIQFHFAEAQRKKNFLATCRSIEHSVTDIKCLIVYVYRVGTSQKRKSRRVHVYHSIWLTRLSQTRFFSEGRSQHI